MNKWLVLEMDGNRKWLFCITWQQPLPCPGKCYHFNYHQLSPMSERAGIFIVWAIPSPHLPKPWAGHTEAKQPVPCGGQGCHWSPRAQGAVRLQSSTFHMARPGTPQLCCVPRLLVSSDKRHLSRQQQWPSHKQGLCSVPHGRGDHGTAAKSHCSRHCNCQAEQHQ